MGRYSWLVFLLPKRQQSFSGSHPRPIRNRSCGGRRPLGSSLGWFGMESQHLGTGDDYAVS